MKYVNVLTVIAAFAMTSCNTSPLGRKQLTLLPEGQVQQMGVAAYQQLKQDLDVVKGGYAPPFVRCVANALTSVVAQDYGVREWEVNVFDDKSANAFALPGGKIGVNSGLLKVAKNQDQLAAVIGHELAHVLARHGNERVSQQLATQTGLQLAATIANGRGKTDGKTRLLLGALGLGAQFGVLMPFSRIQESEADILGLELTARAGFDPAEAVTLWHNMQTASGQKAPPEFLSTHPSNKTRIATLEKALPEARELQRKSLSQNKSPQCNKVVASRE